MEEAHSRLIFIFRSKARMEATVWLIKTVKEMELIMLGFEWDSGSARVGRVSLAVVRCVLLRIVGFIMLSLENEIPIRLLLTIVAVEGLRLAAQLQAFKRFIRILKLRLLVKALKLIQVIKF